MQRLYVTPRKAFADQHAGIFFWSIFRTFLEIRVDQSVVMHDEVLAGHEVAASKPKITNRYLGKVISGSGSDKWQIHLKSEEDERIIKMTVLELRDGQLICDMHTTSWGVPMADLFEPA